MQSLQLPGSRGDRSKQDMIKGLLQALESMMDPCDRVSTMAGQLMTPQRDRKPGAAVSVWSSQFLVSLLYGLQPRDALTLVSAAVTLSAVGALAGWLPVYRASRIDPAEVLRDS